MERHFNAFLGYETRLRGLREPAKAGFVAKNGVSTPCLRDL
jgi:hypothetical protein